MKKVNKKQIIVLIMSSVLIIGIVLGILMYSKYNKKEKITTNEQFRYLGYDNYYSSDSEDVSVGEASKILTSIYANIYDISEVMIEENLDDGNDWEKYAYNLNLISNSEFDYKLSYLRLYELIYDYQVKFNDINTDIENTLNLDNQIFTINNINAVNYLYQNGVIDGNIDNLITDLPKTEFEDIIVKSVFKFNLINIGEETINYEKSLNILSLKEYFFVTNDSDEKYMKLNKIKLDDTDSYLSPKQIYITNKKEVERCFNIVKKYFDIILNIDYETVELDTLYNNMYEYQYVDYSKLGEYINYIKENQIKIEGYTQIIEPIIYLLNDEYHIRIILNVNSNKSNIKLFNDYNKKGYVDIIVKNINDVELKISNSI